MKRIVSLMLTLALCFMAVSLDAEAATKKVSKPYEGRTFAIIGDSYSAQSDNYEWAKAENRWWTLVAQQTGMTCVANNAVAGMEISKLSEEAYNCQNADVIFVLIGMNDAFYGDRSQIYNSYCAMLSKIRDNNHTSEVIMITYPYKLKGDFAGAQEFLNPLLRLIAQESNNRIIDLDTKKCINLADDVHANVAGNKYIGNKIAEVMNKTKNVPAKAVVSPTVTTAADANVAQTTQSTTDTATTSTTQTTAATLQTGVTSATTTADTTTEHKAAEE